MTDDNKPELPAAAPAAPTTAASTAEPAKPDLGIIPPLGLPVGSVRALLTILVLGTTWLLVSRGLAAPPVLRETLILVLGYYFGARSAAATADKLAVTRHPLFLPKGSIRFLILIGFVAAAWKLHQEKKLFLPDGTLPPEVLLVGTFLLGPITKGALALLARVLAARVLSFFGHLLAGATLLVVLSYCVALLLAEATSPPDLAKLEGAFLAVVGFYFGKR